MIFRANPMSCPLYKGVIIQGDGASFKADKVSALSA
jgi:hypothetical protein